MKSQIFKFIEQEKRRQLEGLEMIPSENYVSKDVLEALGSVLTDKYSEGYSGARYYAGNKTIDEIESYCKSLANKIFGTVHANVQPYSGSPANLAVTLSLVNLGDTILGLDLSSGGHLTHGAKASFTGKLFNSISYQVAPEGKINLKEVEELALKHQPKIIWVGGTAYPYICDFKGFSQIAKKVNAYLVADISHIAGLVVGGVHPSPESFVDIITTTTHKTLRGPRGAMILITKNGLKKDKDLPEKIDKAIFPGLQGGPHDNVTASIAIALEESQTPNFKKYTEQIIKNARVLADTLNTKTENHLLLWDLSPVGFGLGYQMQIALEEAGIYVNRNTVPGEPASAFYPSGIRLGTPALTTRGMKEKEMKKIGELILKVLEEVKGNDLPKKQEDRKGFLKNFRKQISQNKKIKETKKEVEKLTKNFPIKTYV